VEAVDVLLALLQVSVWLSGSMVAMLWTMHDAQVRCFQLNHRRPLSGEFAFDVCHGHRRWCESCVLAFNVCE
jgi:hypothetical protein